jgi:ABC-type multidrug transport system fused ATPase/permease subunit
MFCVRDVSFRYDGSGDKHALVDVNFHIEPSSLVVIVGENGSGKTSIANLLAGFHSATSGEILIDGINVQSFRNLDLRQATALLTQDFHIMPLTVSEDIALGDPEDITDDYRVQEAARLGGAAEFIKRLPKKWSTTFQPVNIVSSIGHWPEGELLKYMQSLYESTDVSGERTCCLMPS